MKQSLIFYPFLVFCIFNTSKGKCQSFRSSDDTTLSILHNYKIKIKIFDHERENDYGTAMNAVITFFKNQKGKPKTFFNDSTFCNRATVRFEDFNNDRVKDLLIFYDWDVRSNEMYHLYLVNPKDKRLIRVKGFENVKNPSFNKNEKIIESHVVSGRNYWVYYRINNANKLISYKKVTYD